MNYFIRLTDRIFRMTNNMVMVSVTYFQENNNVIYGHKVCQTREAKWLCLDNIFQKFHRTNFYDIGGTYIEDVADYWFLYKTEQVGTLFLLHLFVSNRQEGSFNIAVSYSNELALDKKNDVAYLPKSLKEFNFKKPKELSQNYLTTYGFTELDVELLKNKKLFIAVAINLVLEKGLSKEILENVKFSHDFGELLKDPICSDFTIESANGDKIKVHKALLTAHSEVFKAMLKEDTAESQNSYVKMVDVSTEDLHCILEFIYTGTVANVDSCNFFNLLMLADRYNLIGLRELSQYALSQQLCLDNALEVLVVADMYNANTLKTAALKFIKQNVSVLQTSTFKEMNNVELIRELCKYLVLAE